LVSHSGLKISSPLPATTSRGSVQQGLSVAGGALGLFLLGLATDERYSLGVNMAVDHFTITWHLTPSGWLSGSSTDFGKPSGVEIERPKDTLESWVLKVYQQSAYSTEERTWVKVWAAPNVSENFILELHKNYPKVNTLS
jgi:hypothetical protein